MRHNILLAVLTCSAAAAACASPQRGDEGRQIPVVYERYSWQDSGSNNWNFCVLYNTSRQKKVKEIFNEKTTLQGVDQLKRKMSDIPPGSKIVWFDRLTLSGHRVRGSEGLKYPPPDIVEDVKRYAEARQIRIEGP